MMNDAISRNALLEKFENLKNKPANRLQDIVFLDGAMSVIDSAPALDVAPVVRCKSCMKRSTFECPMYSEIDGSDYGLDIIVNDRTDDDGYCHCGARMDGDPHDSGQ